MRIAVDWDDTIQLQGGAWTPGVWPALSRIVEKHELVIHSCRFTPSAGFDVEGEVRRIRGELAERGIVALCWTGLGKPIADHYIDDRAWRYSGAPSEWSIIERELNRC